MRCQRREPHAPFSSIVPGRILSLFFCVRSLAFFCRGRSKITSTPRANPSLFNPRVNFAAVPAIQVPNSSPRSASNPPVGLSHRLQAQSNLEIRRVFQHLVQLRIWIPLLANFLPPSRLLVSAGDFLVCLCVCGLLAVVVDAPQRASLYSTSTAFVLD